MKKPSQSSSTSSSSSSTASSSSPGEQFSKPVSSVSASQPSIKPVKPKTTTSTKRTRRAPNPDKTQFANKNPGRRSSIYRGVTRHRWTGRYEAHLWDKNSWNPIQNKKGRQVYLGAYDDEEAAAHTYDLAALKYWGPDTILNFPLNTYTKEYEEMQNVSKEEYLASLRRRSSGFSRGVSKYRGVARHHHNGRWEARIGRVFGNKYLYLGTYSTQEEAAAAYDMAAIEYRGVNAVTNFDMSHYMKQCPQQSQSQAPAQAQAQEPEQASFQQSFAQFNDSSAQELMTPSQVSITPELSVDQSTVIDPMSDHPWSFSLDSGFNPLPVSDMGLEKSSEISDLLNVDTGFEDNIEFFFEGICGGNKLNEEDNGICSLDGIFGNSNEFDGGNLLMEEDAKCGLIGDMENLNDGSTMTSTSVPYPFPIRICS